MSTFLGLWPLPTSSKGVFLKFPPLWFSHLLVFSMFNNLYNYFGVTQITQVNLSISRSADNLNSICSLCRVTYKVTGSGEQAVDIFGGHYNIPHPLYPQERNFSLSGIFSRALPIPEAQAILSFLSSHFASVVVSCLTLPGFLKEPTWQCATWAKGF